jgi:serine protease
MGAVSMRKLSLPIGLVAVAALVCAMTAGPASAAGGTVDHFSTAARSHGYPPTASRRQAPGTQHSAAALGTVLAYGGGPVVTSRPRVYIVFWGTQWGTSSTDSNGNARFSNDSAGAAGQVQQMIKSLGGAGDAWSQIVTQYCQGVRLGSTSCPPSAAHVPYPTGGRVLAGVWYDNHAPAPSAASEPQIGTEAVTAAGHFGNTTATSNQAAQYVIFSPKGTNPDNYKTNGFCAWHDYNVDLGVSSPYGAIALTNLPYLLDVGTSCGQNAVNGGSAGILDGFTIVEGGEYAETLTDPQPASGWTDARSGGGEIADLCGWTVAAVNVTMGYGTYAMPRLWSNATNRCETS